MANSNSRVLSNDDDTSQTSSNPPHSLLRPIAQREATHVDSESDNDFITRSQNSWGALGSWGAPAAIVGVSLVLMVGAALAIPDPPPPELSHRTDRYSPTTSAVSEPEGTEPRPRAAGHASPEATTSHTRETASLESMNVHRSRGFSPVRERETAIEQPNEPPVIQAPKIKLAQQINMVGLGASTSIRVPGVRATSESMSPEAAIAPQGPQDSAPQDPAPPNPAAQDSAAQDSAAQDSAAQDSAPQDSAPQTNVPNVPEPRPEP